MVKLFFDRIIHLIFHVMSFIPILQDASSANAKFHSLGLLTLKCCQATCVLLGELGMKMYNYTWVYVCVHFPYVCSSARRALYFRNRTSCDDYFWYTYRKWWYLRVFFSFFKKILSFWLVTLRCLINGEGRGCLLIFRFFSNVPFPSELTRKTPTLINCQGMIKYTFSSVAKWLFSFMKIFVLI